MSKPEVRRSYAEHVLSCAQFADETSEAARFGTAFHAFVEGYFSHCREQNLEHDIQVVETVAHASFFGEGGIDPNRWQEFQELCYQFAQTRNAGLENLLALEMTITHDVGFALLTCTLDRVDRVEGSAAAPTWVKTPDYKTERAEVDHTFQQQWYSQMLFLRWPSLERITFEIDRVRWPRDPEIHEFHRGSLDEWWTAIMAALRTRLEHKDHLAATGGPACEYCQLRARCADAISPWRDLHISSEAEVNAFFSEMVRHQVAYSSRREVLASYFKERPARLIDLGPDKVELGYLRPRKESWKPKAKPEEIKEWFDANGMEGAELLKVDTEAVTNPYLRDKLVDAGLAEYESGSAQFKWRKVLIARGKKTA